MSNEHKVDLQWTTSRTELWCYYLYYVGNNGLSGFNFGPSQFQNLLFLAGYDPSGPPSSVACSNNGCVLPYLGRVRDSMYPRETMSMHKRTRPNDSQLNRFTDERDKFRDSGSIADHHRRVG